MGLNFFSRPWAFGLCFALFTCFQVTVGLYIAGVLTTLEKQYRITTSVAGLVLSTSDFASLVSIPLVSYVGDTWHRPRIVGVLGVMTAVGGFLSGVPHFLYPAYRDGDTLPSGNSTGSSVFVCDATREDETCSADDISQSGSRIHEMWALLLGQALMGLAYGPLFPIALTYIDDQVKGTTTPYYIAVFFTAGTSATLVGYGEGFLFLSLFVDWPQQYDGTKEWLGAWWMGFIVTSVIMLILSIPFFFFPKEMDVEIKEEDIPKEKLALEGKGDNKISAKDFLMASKRLVTNFVFMALLVGSIFDLAIAASFGFFLAKFLQIQFNIPAAQSSLFVGIIITPGAFLGNIVGGFLVKKLNLDSKGCGKVVVILGVIGMCFIPVVYFLSCPEPTYAGNMNGVISTTNPCNEDCKCSTGRYEPVCGHDGLVYATPCFAGCTGKQENQTDDPNVNLTVYTGCSCSAANATDEFSRQAIAGSCEQTCNMVYYAAVFLFCLVTVGTPANNPRLMMTMRSVGDDKTYALGIQSLFGRALGFLPAPLYFGAAIEGACILDRIECGVTGDCLIYNAQLFRITFLGIFFSMKVGAWICYVFATVGVFRNARKEKEREDHAEELKDGAMQNGLDGHYNKGYEIDCEVGTQTDFTSL
ncbi:solute carrier organic anion transporter family member 5A1-like isoform X1 [Acanthaster planci]|uniref:Solute carrier organic anion transporter family member n=1 Tax=Acanthaster planci TaxID=133434 RepID=A0A8B7ZKT0_ACAPL|nr:solute carrier organic anion transporter family member 5A1-like isoform X1 [Acanthaster planci]